GWLPIFYHPERCADMYTDALNGAAADFDVACPVTVVINDNVDEAVSFVKWTLAFYIGGMGAKDKNFHLDVISRMGFEDDARHVQSLFLDGQRDEPMRAVPDDLADGIALCVPLPGIEERLQLCR